MNTSKAHIIAQLQKDILHLQGLKPSATDVGFDGGLGFIKGSFPNATFPLGAMHEFVCSGPEDVSASEGFIAGIVSAIMQKGGITIWISSSRLVFPPALKAFGIEPDKVIFIRLQRDKDILWVLEEALKCEGLAAVIAETPEISFTASRRFQLAVEQSHVTGFLIRRNPGNVASICVTRWKITPMPSRQEEDLPGVGFPRWQVELLKVRNGSPGKWEIEWAGRCRHLPKLSPVIQGQQRKTG